MQHLFGHSGRQQKENNPQIHHIHTCSDPSLHRIDSHKHIPED
jgi:hypothetical protein